MDTILDNLRQTSASESSYVTGAKNIRLELKRAFPGTKFRVRTSSYSMGCSIRIDWIDGPVVPAVAAITQKYQEGSFDGMCDLYTYNSNDKFTRTHGGAKYVFDDREYSDQAIQFAIDATVNKFGTPTDGKPTLEDWRKGRVWQWSRHDGYDIEREVRLCLCQTDFQHLVASQEAA